MAGTLALTSMQMDTSVQTSGLFSLAAVTTRQLLDTFSYTQYRYVEYFMQVTQGTSYHIVKIVILQDGVNTFKTEYARIFTSANPLITFDATLNPATGMIELGGTLATGAVATAKWHVTRIVL